MKKLFCSKVSHNPYKEEVVTEITEKVFIIDGYTVGDRMLEGIMFCVYFNDKDEVIKIDIENKSTKEYFEDNFNSKKWYGEVKKYADTILQTGDEVDVPSFIKDKYYKNGINVSYIM
jgi:hypothetical protein